MTTLSNRAAQEWTRYRFYGIHLKANFNLFSESGYFMKSLTGIRGIFCVYVFFYHLFPINSSFIKNGLVSVDLFLVLSGYILSYAHEKDFSHKFSEYNVWEFMKKRIFRIFPLNTFIILMVSLLMLIPQHYLHDGILKIKPDAFFTNLLLINIFSCHEVSYNSFYQSSINFTSWSLSAEFILYTFFPFIFYLVNNNKSITTPAFVCSISIMEVIFQLHDHSLPIYGFDALARCACDFVIGILMFNSNIFQMSGKRSIKVDALFVLMLFSFFIHKSFLVSIILFSIIIKNMNDSHSLSEKILSTPLIVYLGDISFSIYMNHLVIGDIMRNVFKDILFKGFYGHEFLNFAIVTLAVSIFTYHCIEKPARIYLRRKFC